LSFKEIVLKEKQTKDENGRRKKKKEEDTGLVHGDRIRIYF